MSGAGLLVRDLRLVAEAAPLELDIAPGAILGLAGLDGHGQDVFLEVLAGLRQPATGNVQAGNGVPLKSLRDAVRQGVAYLPRDRRATGIFPSMSIIDNFAIATPGADARFGLIDGKSRRARYEKYRAELGIVAPRPGNAITTLSGGNQQKVLLARALAHNPRVLLLNDPTRGVDVATRRVLYDVFRRLAQEGMALVVLSSEIEEAVALCQEVLVFRERQVAVRLEGEQLTVERIIAGMFGRVAA